MKKKICTLFLALTLCIPTLSVAYGATPEVINDAPVVYHTDAKDNNSLVETLEINTLESKESMPTDIKVEDLDENLVRDAESQAKSSTNISNEIVDLIFALYEKLFLAILVLLVSVIYLIYKSWNMTKTISNLKDKLTEKTEI